MDMEGTMSNAARICEALSRLGLFGGKPYSESATLTITNQLHITLTLRSEKAIRGILMKRGLM